MHISFATANLYQEPFEDVLEMTAEAGYATIELDLFWERQEWAMAQHLRGVPMGKRQSQTGLQITPFQ